jgi:hypothetical protein
VDPVLLNVEILSTRRDTLKAPSPCEQGSWLLDRFLGGVRWMDTSALPVLRASSVHLPMAQLCKERVSKKATLWHKNCHAFRNARSDKSAAVRLLPSGAGAEHTR